MARLTTRKNPYTSQRKGSGLKWKDLYMSKGWKKFSRFFRMENPVCVVCGADCSPGTGGTVDHIIPVSSAKSYSEAMDLMYRDGNHQTMCAKCNGKKKDK